MVGIDYDDFLGTGGIFSGTGVNGDEYVKCGMCGFGGCDLRIVGCGCTLHARCTKLPMSGPMSNCPLCDRPSNELVLLPMSFREIDEARKATLVLSNSSRGRKRKSSVGNVSEVDRSQIENTAKSGESRRTGRWTNEEIAYVDLIIEKFESGQLPIVDGAKLNDFLANMLKSKQSRLTKKMKNAKLSTRAFRRSTGYIADVNETKKFSDLEDAFCYSIQDHRERAEMKFHMQKEWRDLFSQFCVAIGQPVDADQWLGSVEEMDRRVSLAKDMARRAKRKLIVGNALRRDVQNPDKGVFIDRSDVDIASYPCDPMRRNSVSVETEEFLSSISDSYAYDDMLSQNENKRSKSIKIPPNSSPFLTKAHGYMLRHNVPFEHIDVWVPSFLPGKSEDVQDGNSGSSCRLCYAGCATSNVYIVEKGQSPRQMTSDMHFKLTSFGEYSQKFSFDVGCGLPGRVYQSGVPSWEQSVQNAPLHHFERGGCALECGIKSVVGIPIVSPTVGRIIVIIYSCFDRDKDQELVGRLTQEFTKLLPTPAWKLVVDLGNPCSPAITPEADISNIGSMLQGSTANCNNTQVEQVTQKKDNPIDEIIAILGEHMPSDSSSPLCPYVPGFMSLRLLLLRPQSSWNEQQIDVCRIMFASYTSFSNARRARIDIAKMLARDYMFLMQTNQGPPVQQKTSFIPQRHNSQPNMNMLMDISNHHATILSSPPLRDNVSIIST